jgi:hypothetical protein
MSDTMAVEETETELQVMSNEPIGGGAGEISSLLSDVERLPLGPGLGSGSVDDKARIADYKQKQ